MSKRDSILSIVDKHLDLETFRSHHWEGSFHDYLERVIATPAIARNAFQRIYDMILHFGTERYTYLKHDYVHYKFFDDPFENGRDAVFGLDGARGERERQRERRDQEVVLKLVIHGVLAQLVRSFSFK